MENPENPSPGEPAKKKYVRAIRPRIQAGCPIKIGF
jgi:hypothetical protein